MQRSGASLLRLKGLWHMSCHHVTLQWHCYHEALHPPQGKTLAGFFRLPVHTAHQLKPFDRLRRSRYHWHCLPVHLRLSCVLHGLLSSLCCTAQVSSRCASAPRGSKRTPSALALGIFCFSTHDTGGSCARIPQIRFCRTSVDCSH